FQQCGHHDEKGRRSRSANRSREKPARARRPDQADGNRLWLRPESLAILVRSGKDRPRSNPNRYGRPSQLTNMPTLIEVSHPLIKHHLSRLRDKHTPPAEFRQVVHRLAVLLAYEAT